MFYFNSKDFNFKKDLTKQQLNFVNSITEVGQNIEDIETLKNILCHVFDLTKRVKT